MTQKKIVGLVVGIAVMALIFLFVYRQYTNDRGTAMNTNTTSQKKLSGENSDKVMATPVPDTIDGVTGSIESESSLDVSALDEEESESLNAVNEDSESVNNLGTSYDENNL